MFEKLGVDWAGSLLGFLAVAFLPIPFLFYIYGERLRKMSKYAPTDLSNKKSDDEESQQGSGGADAERSPNEEEKEEEEEEIEGETDRRSKSE